MKHTIILIFCLCCFLLTAAKPPQTLKVCTFNIRLDTPVDGINTWSFRKDSVCSFLLKSNPVIIGFQEVKHNQLVDLQRGLPGFSAIGVGRDDGKEGGEYSPLFLEKSRFKIIDSGTFWLSPTPQIAGSKGWDAAFPRIATWAKVKDRVLHKKICVLNTHFDHMGVEARRQSALLILKKISELDKGCAVIITGDFNSTVSAEAYLTMTDAKNHLQDAHLVAQTKSGESWSFHGFGTVKPAERELIDFIFTDLSFSALKYENPFVEHNGRYLSDHNPLLVTLTPQHRE